jgi:NAD+ synthase (glutamine-hydrolysing)
MKLALVQSNPVIGDIEGNTDMLLCRIAEAAAAGADLVVCSELAICGYPPRDLLERPSFIDSNLRALERLAAGAAVATVVGFVDRTSSGRGRLRNAAAVVSGGAVRSVHHKSLLPTYDVFDEWRYFEPGDRLGLAEVSGVKLGISICEDIWNDADFWPERRYRIDPVHELVELGAELLINISASPFTVHKRALRPRMLSAAAKRHGRPLVMVNQVGGNDDLLFDGGSLALSADGALAARAREFAQDLIYVDVDVASGRARGTIHAVHAHDEQGEAAAALDALVLGTRDYVHKCGFKSALLGLSGGIDSALTAAIAARALGADNVHGVSMPSRYSSEHSVTDARDLAEALGIHYSTIAIEAMFRASLDALAPAFAGSPAGVTEENLQARCRGMVLMALSNEFGHMVLSTGNKSELAVGYCTLYGDMCGGLAVISDVPKTMVYALSLELNRQEGRDVIPRSTLEKPPSAELRPDQTDQDSLPAYELLDAVLALYIEEHRSRDEIVAAGFDAVIVDQVLGMVRASEYKRHQAAPGIKIRTKAFGPGRRMPLAARWRW